MSNILFQISSAETGQLGVRHVQRFWARAQAQRRGQPVELTEPDWRFNNLLLNGLGLGLEGTTPSLLRSAPEFAEFEQWILARNEGQLAPQQVERLNSIFTGQ